MLIIALVLAVIGLAALVTAVVTSNELIAWVCIAASVVGVLLLIVDAVRERFRRGGDERDRDADQTGADQTAAFDADYPDDEARDQSADLNDDRDADTAAVPVDARDDEVAGEDRRGR